MISTKQRTIALSLIAIAAVFVLFAAQQIPTSLSWLFQASSGTVLQQTCCKRDFRLMVPTITYAGREMKINGSRACEIG